MFQSAILALHARGRTQTVPTAQNLSAHGSNSQQSNSPLSDLTLTEETLSRCAGQGLIPPTSSGLNPESLDNLKDTSGFAPKVKE